MFNKKTCMKEILNKGHFVSYERRQTAMLLPWQQHKTNIWINRQTVDLASNVYLAYKLLLYRIVPRKTVKEESILTTLEKLASHSIRIIEIFTYRTISELEGNRGDIIVVHIQLNRCDVISCTHTAKQVWCYSCTHTA